MDTYIIVKYNNGKFGYKHFYELQRYNSIFKKYYPIKESLELTFIESYCIMNNINYKSLKTLDK
jgi:hypothetical protein